MKDRLIALYELHKIDKELEEIESLKGDLPNEIEELKQDRVQKESLYEEIKVEHDKIVEQENTLKAESDNSFKRIQKNDEMLRSGNVHSNEEYDALAKEIDSAYEIVERNDEALEKDITPRKNDISKKMLVMKRDIDELGLDIKEKQAELDELNRQNEEEERELKERRAEVLTRVHQEDLSEYERINKVLFGEAMALVRKGSCLGCYNAIPPQREIEIKMADRFFNCEACGRILIHEDLIK